jgi:hypothetical protein
MFLRILFLPLAALALTLTGCAHELMRGSVAMKVSDTEAHVCMDNTEAKVGDRVTLYKNNCPSKGGGARSGLAGGGCEKVKLGQGSVTEILNQHYSVVKFDSGVPFEEGTFVEKR